MDLSEINIYRITHIENIPHILHYGVTNKNSPNANPNYITIGDTSLIDTRNTRNVYVNNGDFLNFSAPTIILGNFIPFYFGIKMPMLYIIQNGGNFVRNATAAEDIIYLACPIMKIIKSDNSYYFSDGHATDNLTSFYDKSKINDLPALIDWDAIRVSYWGCQENLDIKRRKQAEFFVNNDFPPDFLIGFVCYNETARQKLIKIGVAEQSIRVKPNAYY